MQLYNAKTGKWVRNDETERGGERDGRMTGRVGMTVRRRERDRWENEKGIEERDGKRKEGGWEAGRVGGRERGRVGGRE